MFIAIHLDAHEKSKALKTANDIGWSPKRLVDHILAPLWQFAANQAGDGQIHGLDQEIFEIITHGVAPAGMLDILCKREWLHKLGQDHYAVHDWYDHEPFFYDRARKRKDFKARRAALQELPGTSGKPAEPPGTSELEERRGEESNPDKKRGEEKPPPGFVKKEYRKFLSLLPEALLVVNENERDVWRMIEIFYKLGLTRTPGVIADKMARAAVEAAKSVKPGQERWIAERALLAIKQLEVKRWRP